MELPNFDVDSRIYNVDFQTGEQNGQVLSWKHEEVIRNFPEVVVGSCSPRQD